MKIRFRGHHVVYTQFSDACNYNYMQSTTASTLHSSSTQLSGFQEDAWLCITPQILRTMLPLKRNTSLFLLNLFALLLLSVPVYWNTNYLCLCMEYVSAAARHTSFECMRMRNVYWNLDTRAYFPCYWSAILSVQSTYLPGKREAPQPVHFFLRRHRSAVLSSSSNFDPYSISILILLVLTDQTGWNVLHQMWRSKVDYPYYLLCNHRHYGILV